MVEAGRVSRKLWVVVVRVEMEGGMGWMRVWNMTWNG